jgi:hypothetical protein
MNLPTQNTIYIWVVHRVMTLMSEYTQDDSVDLKGNVSKRGGWKAFFFLVGSLSLTLSYGILIC